ncbi:M28 family metallopeptidase [Pyrinomonas methylaliphatogenes]|uniref:Predicted aminopeptidase n=1 Tax=Pyrinomonas methylaliphatogenes TaxID=454194 RepID=A0A0B6WYZ2_9BACT|nr:M28 family metallopeptidase [Pyrinomonas methylaliphatogenes]CDM65947.1 predicted aminopeptidase [Pyrinomonas methylaliphatogenes]
MRRLLFVIALIVAASLEAGVAQRRAVHRTPKEIDPEIARMIAEIDARRIEQTVRKLVSFGTRNTLSAQDDPKRGIGAARDWIYAQFLDISRTSGGRMTVEKQSFLQEAQPPPRGRVPQPTVITNIIAILRGTQPESADRVYVVSGHYDSMCGSPTDATCDAPGANDDASGVAAVLEMARVMARHQFDATIIFAAVAGEEQGLLGSTYFAEQAKRKGMRIAAMFTNDIIGNTLGGNGVRDPFTVRVFSEGVPTSETPEEARARQSVGGENDSPSRQLARFIKEVGERYVPSMRVWLIYRRDRYGRGGDHIPFLQRGYPAVRFTEPHENFRHQHQNVRTENGIVYGDLPEFVDYQYIARVARINAAALAELARAPAAPRDVRINPRPSDDTELEWEASVEPDLAGYEIVWRETTAPVWTNSRFVGRVTRYTVRGLSKDNYFFGVRAVDRAGHRSPVSYPHPAGARRQ